MGIATKVEQAKSASNKTASSPSKKYEKKTAEPVPVTRTSKKDVVLLMDGRIRIFRTTSQIWQMQTWINEEGKYVRESLHTEEVELELPQFTGHSDLLEQGHRLQ